MLCCILKQTVLWRENWAVLCLVRLVHRDALPSCLHWTVCLFVRSHYLEPLPSQVMWALLKGKLQLWVTMNDIRGLHMNC